MVIESFMTPIKINHKFVGKEVEDIKSLKFREYDLIKVREPNVKRMKRIAV